MLYSKEVTIKKCYWYGIFIIRKINIQGAHQKNKVLCLLINAGALNMAFPTGKYRDSSGL